MVTSNVLRKTFRIRYQGSRGTCFSVDVGDREYIVTARHVVEGISNEDEIEIFREKKWHQLESRVVGHGQNDVDITVLAMKRPIAPPNLPLPPDSDGIVFGQDVFFLGYPYDLYTELGEINAHFPVPFIKKAILSSMTKTDIGSSLLFLDGHNNPGFSGGPVAFVKPGTTDFKVAGVISGYRFEEEPVFQQDEETGLSYHYNTGIIIAYGADHIVELVKANPIGNPRAWV